MKIYQFIGQGRGVPGLPHSLTEADVQRLGVETLLADAIKNKQYKVIEPKTAPVQPSNEETERKPAKKRDKEA